MSDSTDSGQQVTGTSNGSAETGMMRFFGFFIDNYRFTFLLTAFTVLAGVLGFAALNRETRPPVSFAIVTISTVFPGSSALEVEERITNKIEAQIQGVSGIRDYTSISQSGLSTITVRIDMDRYNVDKVIEDIEREVGRVQDLPPEVLDLPSVNEINAAEVPVLELAITGKNDNRQRDRVAELLQDLLEGIGGVKSVRLIGERAREFQVLLDQDKLVQQQVGSSEVVEAVAKRNQNIPAGYVESPTQRKLVRINGQVDEAKQLADTIVRTNFTGGVIRVKDVAGVKDGYEDSQISALVDGEPSTLIVTTKRADADAITTVNALKAELKAFSAKHPEFGFKVYNDEADRVAERLDIVIGNALSGMIVVLVLLMIFLPGIVGFVTTISLFLGVAGTLAFMPVVGANFNTVTMLAIVIILGMMVDNAIVISENYARLRAEGMERTPAAKKAVHQFWLPLTATALTTVAAFLPMLVTLGIMGQFIKWIPIVVTVGLAISVIEGFILLPARLRFTLRKPQVVKDSTGRTVKKGNWFTPVAEGFERMSRQLIRFRYLTMGCLTAVIVASLVLAIFGNKFVIFPKEDVEFYFARFQASNVTSLDQMGGYASELSKKIEEAMPEGAVHHIVGRVGVQRFGLADSNEKNSPNVGMFTISVPLDQAQKLDVEEVLSGLRAIDKGPLEDLSFEAGSNGPPVGTALSVTLRSDDYAQLDKVRNAFKAELTGIPGVFGVGDNEIAGAPEYQIIPNYDAMARAGLDVQTIGTALRTSLQGSVVSRMTADGREFDVRVRLNDKRETLEAVKATRVRNRQGNLVPLLSVAKLVELQGPAIRRHFNSQRAITIFADTDTQVLTSVELNQKADKILKDLLAQNTDVTSVIGGEQESTNESVQSLFRAMILAVFAIFGILVFLFGSYSHSILVLSTIPLGLIGVSGAFYLHDRPLSFFALIGVVGLAGVVVNAAIVLVSYISELMTIDGMSLHDALARASAQRLRAVLATVLTTVGGLMPTAYGIGGYDSVLVPMTLALAWGLVSATILTLIWVPCGYAIIDDVKRLFQRFSPATARAAKEV
jgi:multidrug efflux pump subunit AcrB